MPIDKAIDSVQLDANLTAVADAIRAKGETTEQLVFPGGFVTAIQDISTGAALNFQVVVGTTEPENPTENTIWVSTDQAITGWVFSHNQPDSPSEGMVWIVNGVSNASEFSAVSDVELRVQIASAKQYISGAWALKTVQIYQNGAWVSTNLYLYNSGNEYSHITGGWAGRTFENGGSTSKTSTTLVAVANSSGYNNAGFSTINKVNVTGYKTLKMQYDLTGEQGNLVLSNVYVDSNSGWWNYAASIELPAGTNQTAALSLVDGSYYILFYRRNGSSGGSQTTITCHKVWLE